MLLFSALEDMWSALQLKPQRNNSITVAKRLCNFRIQNAHLWLQAEAEQESAIKNPLKKLFPKNDGACPSLITSWVSYPFIGTQPPNPFTPIEVI